ncbi:hypothetical protein LIER_09219 [Lithospermum erythrorhizon]|uniref:Uncharacterized protein n=1 Tax=Lithospermum erythrorhizon TaxID=34254 RepID=A0AAV3PIS1_LITER
MDIDKNDIQILASKIPKILVESLLTLLKRNPKASFAWFSIFVSYIFFPGILWFLIYTIPFIVLITAISIKTYISVHKARDAKKHEEPKDCKSPRKVQSAEDASDENRTYNEKHARSVRRRKSKVIFAESGQDSVQEKEAIYSTNFTHDLIDKRALLEETTKDILEVEANAVNDHVESSPSDVSLDFQSRFNLIMRSQAFGGLNTEGVSSKNTEDEGDEMREEERTANQGVEDDQKNLPDLGLSEIERNKRLENLIARRRAKKILTLPIRRAMMNMGHNDSHGQNIYPIVIHKSNPSSPRSDQFTPGPVSAPSASSNTPILLTFRMNHTRRGQI